MNSDAFGNLRDWGSVPEQLNCLQESGKLTEHQEELVRILRYPHNWRLRELVLHAVQELDQPSDQILLSVVDILADEGLYYETRVLAAQALRRLVQTIRNGLADGQSHTLTEITRRLEALRQCSHEPVLDAAIHGVWTALGSLVEEVPDPVRLSPGRRLADGSHETRPAHCLLGG